MYYLKTIFFALIFPFSVHLPAQITESGDLVTKIGAIIDNMPGDNSDDYIPPTNTEITNWETGLLQLLQKNFVASEQTANQLNYDLIKFIDNGNNQIYYILESREIAGNHWGTYVFNPAACQSNLIIQSPHSRNDSNTGDQGIYILKEIGAIFYMVAGTHRCNNTTFSTCSGTTTTCHINDESEKYRQSDMAHIDNTIFQKTTEILLDKISDPYFIQLHGFAKKAADPFLILSNGTTLSPPKDYLTKLGHALVSIDPSLTFEVAHINTSIRLKGTTNTQGRFINGSSNPCSVSSPTNSGRFLHIEQEKSKLRANAIGWQKMADALAMTFRNLQLGSSTLFLDKYSSQDTLTTANTISNQEILDIKSGKIVQLENGFHAATGSNFVVKIAGCSTVSPLQPAPMDKTIFKNRSSQVLKIGPNPFSNSISIQYQLPAKQSLFLAIYHVSGQLVKILVNHKEQRAGNYNYINKFSGGDLTEGMYFVLWKTDKQIITKKVILSKK